MKILIVGKYPPIQGGVSARTYRYAHSLASRGHEVHVITNAKEVASPFRMLMRDEDWARCDGVYGDGYVRVHWTDPPDRSQSHIPMNSAVVTKLASIGMDVTAQYGADVVFSYYTEPYAVAGHMIAEAGDLPHVIRTAGSDAGRLWLHPQFAALYDYIYRSATLLTPGATVARKMKAIDIPAERFRKIRTYTIDTELFSTDGPRLDVAALLRAARSDPAFAPLCWGDIRDDIPYFGVYGKLWPNKGTEELLRTIGRLKDQGCEIGLLMMGHARPRVAKGFHKLMTNLGLCDRVVQLPFLPNWRVPEFIRRCLAICYLEQDFPIIFHAPIVAREVMASGACLVASTEILRKAPFADNLVHGYNCVAINDVSDIDELAGKLASIVKCPELTPDVGARGRRAVLDYQNDLAFPKELEDALEDAVTLGRSPAATGNGQSTPFKRQTRVPRSQEVAPERLTPSLESSVLDQDPLFRLTTKKWAMADDEINSMVPAPMMELQVTWNDSEKENAPIEPAATTSDDIRPDVERMTVDGLTFAVVGLCDGKNTIREIAGRIADPSPLNREFNQAVIERIMQLFDIGILRLDSR